MSHNIPLSSSGKPRRAYGPSTAWRIPTSEDIAYAAGFFDGEGNIVIASNNAGGNLGKYLTYNMRVGCAQNDPIPLFWFRERWGGSVRKSSARGHMWQQFSLGALEFLRQVEPFLIVKRERALLAIEYQQKIVQRGRRGRSPEYIAWAADVKRQMNVMNARPGSEARL